MFFFFNDTATTEIYTLSLHDALPISGAPEDQGVRREVADPGGRRVAGDARVRQGRRPRAARQHQGRGGGASAQGPGGAGQADRKSTRLNSSHSQISYAVFCLNKKKHI